MADQGQPPEISQAYTVRNYLKGSALPVPDPDWRFLKEKIREIAPAPQGWRTTWSVAVGVAFTALIGAFSISSEASVVGISASVVCWLLFAISGTCFFLALIFDRKQPKAAARTREDVIKEMERIEARCGPGDHTK
jgi:hypothetical protein